MITALHQNKNITQHNVELLSFVDFNTHIRKCLVGVLGGALVGVVLIVWFWSQTSTTLGYIYGS